MARKKKRRLDGEKKLADAGRGFDNRPFSGIRLDMPPEPSVKARVEQPDPPQKTIPDDSDALMEMMNGVTPIDGVKLARKDAKVRPLLAEMDDSELVMRHLDELVYGDGNVDFDIAETEEYIEAAVRELDKRTLKKLRRGDYSYQRHLDLHNMRRDEARLEVARFIDKACKDGKRCVLIVHGRGLGSKDNIPVLKEKLRAWLTRGAMGKKVLAYTSAQPTDGGTGAVYVLLRS